MKRSSCPLTIQFYFLSTRALSRAYAVSQAALVGFWLGAVRHEQLHQLDKICYDKVAAYFTAEWNQRGLFPWEQCVIDRYFGHCQHLLVGATGGGREVIALVRAGYDVDGFECHPGFMECANRLLLEEGYPRQIELAPRDECPDFGETYDGIIVGWSAYMSIPTRRRRIAFLKRLKAHARPHAPVLVSFRYRSGSERRFRIIRAVGNLIRWVLRREGVELGDDLAPCYVHYFTQEELAAELHEADFDLAVYETQGYGHAVGIAREAGDGPPVETAATGVSWG